MNNASLPYVMVDKQGIQGCYVMFDRQKSQFISYIHSLIREYATKKEDAWYLFAADLPDYEQRIFLSYIVRAHEFADLTSTPHRQKVAIAEHIPTMQWAIDDNIDNTYHAYNFEMQHGAYDV